MNNEHTLEGFIINASNRFAAAACEAMLTGDAMIYALL